MKKFLLSLAAAALWGSAMATTVTFDSTTQGYENQQDITNVYIDGVTIEFDKGSNKSNAPKYYTSGTAIRVYGGNTVTVTAPAGETLENIEFTFGTGDGTNAITASTGTFESSSWTGEAQSVVFTVDGTSGNRRFQQIAVTFGEGGGGTITPDPEQPDQPGDEVTDKTVTFDFASSTYGAGPAYTDSNTPYVTDQNVATSNGASVTFTGSDNAWRFWSDGIRAYKNKDAKFTVSADGKTIKNISWTVKSGATFALEGTTDNITSWEGEADSVAFVYTNTSSNLALITLTVTYESDGTENPEQPEQPDVPTAPEGVITVTEALQLITDGYTGTAQVKGIISEIQEISTQYGNATYIIKDAATDADGLTVYRGLWLDGAKFTAGNEIEVGGTVTVEGSLTLYGSTPEMNTGSKILSYEAPQGGDTPDQPTPGGNVNVAFYATDSYNGDADYSEQIAGTLVGDGAQSFTAGDISFYFEKVNNSSSNVTNNQVRWYQGDIMHITPSNGAVITKIVINEVSSYNKDATPSIGSTTLDGTTLTWTGSTSEEMTLTANQQIRFTLMTITYEIGEAPAVEMPKISCTDNEVTITCATEGAEIYYTINGAEPSKTSTLYNAPFEISETVTVKAIAYVGEDASTVASYIANYVGNYAGFQALIESGSESGTVDGPITAVYQNGQYLYVVDAQDYPMLVYGNVSASLENGDEIASITGKYSPYNGLPEMTNPVLGDITSGEVVEPTVVEEELTAELINRYVRFESVTLNSTTEMEYAGNKVVLYKRFNDVEIPTDYAVLYNVEGFVSTYNGTLQVYPTAFEAVEDEIRVETPVIYPEGGSIAIGSEVTITCETEGALIYFTTDGTVPTEDSVLYEEPIVVNSDVTIKAIAYAEGMTASAIASATFTVFDPNAAFVTFDFTTPSTLDPNFSDEGEANNEVVLTGVTLTAGPISILSEAAEGASSQPRLYYGSGNSAGWTYRFYKDNTITISATEGYLINKIEFDGTNLSNASVVYSDNGTFENNVWTANMEKGVTSMSITKTATGNNPTIKTITVNYSEDVESGVTAIEDCDDSEAIYYNLQGVRVNNPERGIYVKVQNGKATKVVK